MFGLLQNIFGSMNPTLQPGQSAGPGMPMNILPQVAQQGAPQTGGGLMSLVQGNSPSGGLMGFLNGSPSQPSSATPQMPQQNMQLAPAPLAPLQMPTPNYGMLNNLFGRMI